VSQPAAGKCKVSEFHHSLPARRLTFSHYRSFVIIRTAA
jgi:hypothetical protein